MLEINSSLGKISGDSRKYSPVYASRVKERESGLFPIYFIDTHSPGAGGY